MLLHALIPASRANGPGLRAVVFFQGCSIGCAKCWNPKSHQFHGQVQISAALLLVRNFPFDVRARHSIHPRDYIKTGRCQAVHRDPALRLTRAPERDLHRS